MPAASRTGTRMSADYIMVGGFLGAGKTTAMLRLAEHLTQRGQRVGGRGEADRHPGERQVVDEEGVREPARVDHARGHERRGRGGREDERSEQGPVVAMTAEDETRHDFRW